MRGAPADAAWIASAMTRLVRQPAPTPADARELDALDPLAPLRERFWLPDGVSYFDGNSLGALPVTVSTAVKQAIEADWGMNLIGSWFDRGWWEAPLRVGDLIAGIVGCAEGQIVVGESVSVQIFNLLTAAVRMSSGRTRILVDADAFPSDRYMASSVARLLGVELKAIAMAELSAELAAHGDEVAVVLASAVDYRSGERWDVAEVTRRCHQRGVLAMWDLSHAAGAIDLQLDDDDVDLAVGCTYKYLSGGPGAPSFAYVAARHQGVIDLPLTGWHGHRRPFDFAVGYVPACGIARARVGTPQILSMLALEDALSVFRQAPIGIVRDKSLALGSFFLECLDALAPTPGVACITPREPHRRGSHIALTHPRSDEVMSGLLRRGVVCDRRPPDILRFGFNALYVSFEDIHTAARSIVEAIAELR
jgi:kynureninase